MGVYIQLLVRRYLTTRIIPLIAVGAVALCVALVVVVVSVMSGFLDMVRNSGRTLVGDVVLSWDIVGIPDYPELIAELEILPEVEAASPVIDQKTRRRFRSSSGFTPRMRIFRLDVLLRKAIADLRWNKWMPWLLTAGSHPRFFGLVP